MPSSDSKTQRPPRRDLKLELLDAGRAVFAARGYDAVRVEDLLETAGVSRHSFYRIFESKHDVLMQLLEQVASEVVDGIDHAVSTTSEPSEKVRCAVHFYFGWMLGVGAFWRVVESQQAVPGSRPEALRERTLERIRAVVEREAFPVVGEVARDEFVVSAMLAAIEGIGRQLLDWRDGPQRVDRLTEVVVALVWRLLEPQSGPTH